MNRRRVLSGSATTVALLVAGCLDDASESMAQSDDSSDDPSSDEGSSETDGASGNESSEDDDSSDDDGEREADRAIKRAVTRLNKVALALKTVRDQLDDPTSVEFDADEERTRLEEARDYLDEAESATDGDRRADVDELRAYADALARMVAVTASLTDTDLEAEFTAVRSAIEEGRTEDARSTIRSRREDTQSSLERLRPAVETLEGVDAERLAAMEVDVEPVRDGAAKLEAVLESIVALTRGIEPITGGYEHLVAGQDRLEERELDAAAESFEAAKVSFDDSVAKLEAGAEDAPAVTADQFEAGLCRARALRDAAKLFLEAIEAAKNRDRDTAESKRDAAKSRLEEADDCA